MRRTAIISSFLLDSCCVCGKPSGGPLCPVCLDRVRGELYDNLFTRCPACGNPLPWEDFPCRFCGGVGGTRVLVLSPFAGLTRYLIEELKYTGKREIASPLATLYTRAVRALFPLSPPVIVPIPASYQGRRKRGFDQMKLIASQMPFDTVCALKRIGGYQQKRLDRQARLQVAGKMFTADLSVLPPERPVVVIDDVVTTGASVISALDCLRGRQCAAVVLAGFPLKALTERN